LTLVAGYTKMVYPQTRRQYKY